MSMLTNKGVYVQDSNCSWFVTIIFSIAICAFNAFSGFSWNVFVIAVYKHFNTFS